MSKFNVRVYGICINSNSEILVTDEKVGDFYFTKFPGGGLEYGEGTLECLQREFLEEANIKIEVVEHLYTTDFFQENAFKKDSQILSIYYYMKLLEQDSFPVSRIALDLDYSIYETQNFRWLPLNLLNIETVTLPIDKHVVKILLQKMKNEL